MYNRGSACSFGGMYAGTFLRGHNYVLLGSLNFDVKVKNNLRVFL